MKTDVFNYPDTNTTRANIGHLTQKLEGHKIAIIGLGGTGSYILDQIAKTPVDEIHLYDGDVFQLHNAFRSPGAIEGTRLDAPEGIMKVDYYHEVYSRMHSGIFAHPKYITKENLSELSGFSFVFISVDRNDARYMMTNGLVGMKVPFIDVGLGVKMLKNGLTGTLRVTMGTPVKNDHLVNRIGEEEFEENMYSTNIQIADLNCLNAMLAVIKWKKFCGFYQDLKEEHNILYFINSNRLLNDDHTA